MKHILVSFIFCGLFVSAKSQSAENLIRNFFAGFEKRDWNMVASQVSADFTFTSPNADDHITLQQYKEKCWGNVEFFKKIEFHKIVVDGNTAFAMYNITTSDNKVVRNVEYYTFSNGKIKSIETFFGTGVGYPGNSENVK
jgi:SnoaL-like domain